MERDKREQGGKEQGFVHPDAVMDAALNWLITLQGAPDDTALAARFRQWQQADPAHAAAFDTVAAAWNLPEMDMVAKDVAARTMPSSRPPEVVVLADRRGKRGGWTRGAMAAAAVLLLAVGIQQYPALRLQWQADYITQAGARDEITLPDGSRMILNTASAVSLDFEGSKRSVTLLQGEAYFDVVPDPARPFTVAAAFSEVEVKGTAFSVRTESTEDTVVLEHGHVDVTRLPERAETASLEPGESIIATAAAFSGVRKTDPGTSHAWLQGRVVFEDQPFDQVLGEIERYYGHTVVVANGQLSHVRINGNYRLDNPERVIRSLATAAGADVTRLPGGILILR
ncbi:FecR domain-containing protein [Shinella sp. HZN7]|uniref:FecR family protein n=1 Tax=Shinella sp. (strain HZN7) TaxID=879274 RepID=UPI0007DA76E3|nr:FecR domain-containing protein [Shinella sp. HZN7]ANH03414.1 iron dicitrate transport regulator FecR [Shinella sp. HZN7]